MDTKLKGTYKEINKRSVYLYLYNISTQTFWRHDILTRPKLIYVKYWYKKSLKIKLLKPQLIIHNIPNIKNYKESKLCELKF